jgi:hypothetical protein
MHHLHPEEKGKPAPWRRCRIVEFKIGYVLSQPKWGSPTLASLHPFRVEHLPEENRGGRSATSSTTPPAGETTRSQDAAPHAPRVFLGGTMKRYLVDDDRLGGGSEGRA